MAYFEAENVFNSKACALSEMLCYFSKMSLLLFSLKTRYHIYFMGWPHFSCLTIDFFFLLFPGKLVENLNLITLQLVREKVLLIISSRDYRPTPSAQPKLPPTCLCNMISLLSPGVPV